jgi:biopolymer transport protein ExbD
LNLKDRADKPENTVLGIDNEGKVYLNKVPTTKEALPGQLKAEMQKHIANDEPQIMFVKADRNLKWEKVDELLKLARDADVPMAAVISDKVGGDEKKEGK